MTEYNRIVIDPQICHGSPCVRGLRYPVTIILELLAPGCRTRRSLQTMQIWKRTTFERVCNMRLDCVT